MTDAPDFPWRPALVAGAATLATAVAGGLATEIGAWYHALRKPSWQPPDWAFGPAWTVIFALTATAATVAWNAAERGHAFIVLSFVANALLNVLWSVLFFRRRRPDWALVEVVALWLSIVEMILVVLPASRTAALLLLPYLAWVTFAAALNRAVVRLNGPFPNR